MEVEIVPAAPVEVESTVSDAKQRVLDVAEQLFMERGYAAVTLRDIADALGMRQASLYYHFPDGKEQLFVAMAERVFERHRMGMEQAVGAAGPEIGAQLHAVARWFGSQPAINFIGMMHADMPALSADQRASVARRLCGHVRSPAAGLPGRPRARRDPLRSDEHFGRLFPGADGRHHLQRNTATQCIP